MHGWCLVSARWMNEVLKAWDSSWRNQLTFAHLNSLETSTISLLMLPGLPSVNHFHCWLDNLYKIQNWLHYSLGAMTCHPYGINSTIVLGFPGGSDGKASAYNAGDLDSIPGLGRCPGEGNSNPLQHSCLENPMDGGAWQATVYGVAKSQTRLSDFTSLH